jgi:hypothetical protein
LAPRRPLRGAVSRTRHNTLVSSDALTVPDPIVFCDRAQELELDDLDKTIGLVRNFAHGFNGQGKRDFYDAVIRETLKRCKKI